MLNTITDDNKFAESLIKIITLKTVRMTGDLHVYALRASLTKI